MVLTGQEREPSREPQSSATEGMQTMTMAFVVNRWARAPGMAMNMATATATATELWRNAPAHGNAVYQKSGAAPTVMARYRSSGSGGEGGGGGGGRRRRMRRRGGGGGGRRRGGGNAHIIQVDMDVEVDADVAKRVEEVVRHAMVERAAPDWLPFLPGSSYWVPPPPPRLAQSIQIAISNPLSLRVTSASASDPHAHLLSFATSPRGWPSSAYFLREGPSNNGEAASENTDKSEEEEN